MRCMPEGSVVALSIAAFAFCTAAAAAPVQFACSGPKVDAARKIAKGNDLKLGMDPGACFGEMKLTEGDRRQIVVVAPSAQCKTGKLLNVYDQSRAGPWYALFKTPVCGNSISVGPRSPYGDNMITIDGRSYLEKGDSFVPLK
jgi:hypothetical protein